MKPEKDMNLSEFKEYFFKSKYYRSQPLKRLLKIIGVTQYKFYKKKLTSGWVHRVRFNPVNPLTYLVVVLLIIIGLIITVWNYIKDIPSVNFFKWN